MTAATKKDLVIVESPAKAKTIGRFLGAGYQVEASYGHVRDLPRNAKEIPAKVRGEEWARLGVNVDDGFAPLYVVPTDKKKHVKRLKDALRNADRLLLATDEDREGESISWHVLELLKPKKSVEVQRIVFHEVTPEAIARALETGRDLDDNLVRAQEARRVLDRLYGYSLSPLLWKRVAPGLSAGRVQSVAVRLLVERERQRITFVRAGYSGLQAQLDKDGQRFKARLRRVDGKRVADSKSFEPETGKLADTKRILLDESRAETLAKAVGVADSWSVASVDRTPGAQRPAPPFITSTLQQEANRKLRFSSRRTMSVAQRLYEGIELAGERIGLITYMRTDSVTLSQRAISESRQVIEEAYGKDYLPKTAPRYKTKAKRAQEAHEAIRPTDLSRRPQDVKAFLDDEQHRLYELIWKRTIASQMVAAQLERTSVEITVDADGAKLDFAVKGRRIVFPGFLRAYVEGRDDPEAQLGDQEVLLPHLEEGDALEALEVGAEHKLTKPPYRYTEASLVRKLEEEGIGRPSTYSTIISTILDRGYATRRANELIPSFTALCVTELLEDQFADLVDTAFTAGLEDELDLVAAGEEPWMELITRFYLGGENEAGLRRRVDESEVSYPEVAIGKDPKSGEPIVVKVGRYGPYVRRGAGGKENTASIPEGTAPDQLNLELALALLKGKSEDEPPLVIDPENGRAVKMRHGRFGAYLELEQSPDEKESGDKPKRVSIPKGLSASDLDPDTALRLIRLPRILGTHPDTGAEISTAIGRYGPFVRHEKDYRNLTGWQQACELELSEALAIFAQPKPARRGQTKTILKELGTSEETGKPIQVIDGRYGPYVSDGKVNATLPKTATPLDVTIEQANELLAIKRAAPARPKRRRRA